MNVTVVRYKVRPDAVEENARLIGEVMAELDRVDPPDLRYLVLRLDGQRFLHVALTTSEPSPLVSLPSFGRFRHRIAERCVETPQSDSATLLGNYRSPGS